VSPPVTAKWPKGSGGPAGDETQNLHAWAGSAVEEDLAAPLLTQTGGLRSTDIDGATWVASPAITFTLQPADKIGGKGALVGLPIDTAPALDTTAEARLSDRGVRVAGEFGVRRLTPRECERLQSFPDDWTVVPGVKCPDTRRYAAMGNAVTVNVAELIGRRMLAIDAGLA